MHMSRTSALGTNSTKRLLHYMAFGFDVRSLLKSKCTSPSAPLGEHLRNEAGITDRCSGHINV